MNASQILRKLMCPGFFVQPSLHEIRKLGGHRRQCHMQYHDAMEHSHIFRFKKALYSLKIIRHRFYEFYVRNQPKSHQRAHCTTDKTFENFEDSS